MTGLIPPEEMTDEPAQPIDGASGDDLVAVRDLIVRTHADAVPELIGGATVAELLASIEPAREAYARIAARMPPPVTSAAAHVPAGGAGPAPIDPARLSPAEKIRRGLAG